MQSRHPPRGALRSTTVALAVALTLLCLSTPGSAGDPAATLGARDAALIDARLGAFPVGGGQPELFVLGIAGDGHEDVFRNEVTYLETLADARLAARGRVLLLVNHPDSLGAARRPLATWDNLVHALEGIGAAMGDEDVLLLYVATHGTADHELVLQLYPVVDDGLTPEDLADALDEAGIRNRVVVVSACFAGGFIPALRNPDTLVIAAARHDRTSFGCGSESVATYFGRAWLIEGMNRGSSFIGAYDHAARTVARREREDDFDPSLPQIAVGARIGGTLQRWQATLPQPAPAAVPYPHREPRAAAGD
ncbi:MAG TPA: C13 family peptidase [Luteimonas sp.]|nr:C13 family peptidase [Luteimonas sp.]